MIGEHQRQIIQTAIDEGICKECPLLSQPLQEAVGRDEEEVQDSVRSDEEILALYDDVGNVEVRECFIAIATFGLPTLREGRKARRSFFTEGDINVLKGLKASQADPPCRGTVQKGNQHPRSTSPEVVIAMQDISKTISEILGLPPRHVDCELSRRRTRELLRQILEEG